MDQLRFHKLRVWEESVNLAVELIILAEALNKKRHFGISGQLERACLSISNNIAEGSGSASKKEFAHFLNISKRSAYECINMIHILRKIEIIDSQQESELLGKLVKISAQLTMLRKHLLQ